jgi:hypothetical protein
MAPFIDLAAATAGTAAVIGAVQFVRWQITTFNRPATEPRVRPVRAERIDLDTDFFGGTGQTRLAVALARENKDAAGVKTPASRTKETPFASSN